jgi:hypothetical protein
MPISRIKEYCCPSTAVPPPPSPQAKEDAKLKEKWEKFGLPSSVLERHIDCARFLLESSLLFKIVGFRESSRNRSTHQIRVDRDGMPMIKVQGAFRRWDVIKRELVYDAKNNQILSSAYPGSIAQSWSYISPEGLVPIDRLNHDRVVRISRLENSERRQVLAHAKKFYENNPEVDQGVPKDWVVQFATSPSRQFVSSIPPLPDHPLLDNLARNLNTHVVMRLIGPQGEVYSFGIEMPMDSQNFLWENGLAKFLGTVTATVNKTGDYEEFRPHPLGSYITSVPLTPQRARNILNLINHLGSVRFNFLGQNCLNLAVIVLKEAGYHLDTRTTVKETLYDMLPSVKHIPLIGPVIELVNQIFRKIFSVIAFVTPECIKNVVTSVSDVVLFVPRKIGTLAINLLIRHFGGETMLHALPDGVEEEPLYDSGRFLNFSRLIRSWTDLFKEQTQTVYHSKYFVEWQKKQKSTFHQPPSSLPKLAIVPP